MLARRRWPASPGPGRRWARGTWSRTTPARRARTARATDQARRPRYPCPVTATPAGRPTTAVAGADRIRRDAVAGLRLTPMAPYKTPEYHPAFEEYCETIFELREDDVDVIQARIAERLDVSRPAVSEMIHRMEHQGLVTVDGAIRLTDDGLQPGRERRAPPPPGRALPHRHPRAVVGRGPRRGRQVGARDLRPVEAALVRLLGEPTTCPHGNPIPGSDYQAPDAVPLDELAVGDHFTVSRIPEELEFAPGLLEFLEESPPRARQQRRGHRRRRPTAPPPSRSTASTSASAPSPAPASSSRPEPSGLRSASLPQAPSASGYRSELLRWRLRSRDHRRTAALLLERLGELAGVDTARRLVARVSAT